MIDCYFSLAGTELTKLRNDLTKTFKLTMQFIIHNTFKFDEGDKRWPYEHY